MIRSIKITTATADEDILKNIDIQKRICERLAITEDKYLRLLGKDGIKMDLTISFSATNKVSVNDNLFDDIFEDSVFTTGGKILVKNVKIKTPATFFVLIDVD